MKDRSMVEAFGTMAGTAALENKSSTNGIDVKSGKILPGIWDYKYPHTLLGESTPLDSLLAPIHERYNMSVGSQQLIDQCKSIESIHKCQTLVKRPLMLTHSRD